MEAYDPGGLQDQKRSYPEMGSLIHTMYADFIKRVHKSQQNSERPPFFCFAAAAIPFGSSATMK